MTGTAADLAAYVRVYLARLDGTAGDAEVAAAEVAAVGVFGPSFGDTFAAVLATLNGPHDLVTALECAGCADALLSLYLEHQPETIGAHR